MSSKTPEFSPETCKDAKNPGPEVFDGLRFEKLRNLPGQEGKHQAVTTGLVSYRTLTQFATQTDRW
jgi:hypothetical protein